MTIVVDDLRFRMFKTIWQMRIDENSDLINLKSLQKKMNIPGSRTEDFNDTLSLLVDKDYFEYVFAGSDSFVKFKPKGYLYILRNSELVRRVMTKILMLCSHIDNETRDMKISEIHEEFESRSEKELDAILAVLEYNEKIFIENLIPHTKSRVRTTPKGRLKYC